MPGHARVKSRKPVWERRHDDHLGARFDAVYGVLPRWRGETRMTAERRLVFWLQAAENGSLRTEVLTVRVHYLEAVGALCDVPVNALLSALAVSSMHFFAPSSSPAIRKKP